MTSVPVIQPVEGFREWKSHVFTYGFKKHPNGGWDLGISVLHQPIEDVIQDAARMVELVEGWMKSQANTSCECSKRSSVETVI